MKTIILATLFLAGCSTTGKLTTNTAEIKENLLFIIGELTPEFELDFNEKTYHFGKNSTFKKTRNDCINIVDNEKCIEITREKLENQK
ncbi:hypothetical protein [Teredinibacter turnerae]|uniref:hypothetical protein n=1 Tax=Teredinibacter turnerae TaxID=2426 RepID=UPI000365978F|nr:hypothetical protein [Teredinibacter turnerae]